MIVILAVLLLLAVACIIALILYVVYLRRLPHTRANSTGQYNNECLCWGAWLSSLSTITDRAFPLVDSRLSNSFAILLLASFSIFPPI